MADERTTPTPLVGRAAELEILRTAIGLESGVRSAVVLGGDAGIGKTRLLRELAAEAQDAGGRVVVGHCLDLGDTALPFQPFVEVFGRIPEAERGDLAVAHPALVPWLRLSGSVPSAGVDRGELFAAVAAGLDFVAADQPLLVVVEDAHWADTSTRHLVRFLLAYVFTHDVSLVVSYRADDLFRRHPLRDALAEWVRLPDVRRLELTPLSDAAVADLLIARSAARLDGRALGAILRRAAGNAFFAEELVDAGLDDDGTPLPETLADLLLVRLDRLDDTARLVVRAASCAAVAATEDVLGAVTDLPPVEVEAGVRAAVDQRVLVRTTDGYGFRHALLAEAVREDLLPAERQRIHRAYLRVIDGGHDASAAALAAHALGAHDLDRAFEASVAAGHEAMRLSGPDEAERHFEQALTLADHRPEGFDLHGLVADATEAATSAGHVIRASDLIGDHVAQLPPDTSDADRVRLLIVQSTAAYLASREELAEVASARAVDLVGEEPGELRARALAVRALVMSDMSRDPEAIEIAEQGLALAERLDLPDVVSDVATTLTRVLSRTGMADLEKSRQRYLELIERSRASGHLRGELRGLHNLGFVLYSAGRLDDAEIAFRAAMRVAVAHGRPWTPYGFDGRLYAAVVAYLRGRWNDAMDLLEVPPGGPRTAVAMADAVASLVLEGRGDDRVLEIAPRLRTFWDREISLLIHGSAAQIESHGRHHDAAAAEAVHDDFVDVLARTWKSDGNPARLRHAALLVAAFAAAAPTTGRPGRAQHVERAVSLAAQMDDLRGGWPNLGPEGVAWASRLTAEVSRLRWITGVDPESASDLAAAWRRNIADFETFGAPYEVARSRIRLAAVIAAEQPSDPEVTGLLAAARITAEALGAAPLVADIDAISGRDGTTIADLTAREREVLMQVAAGLSNGEIAKRLFISTKTVSVHVSNILAKLDATSRTEAVSIARRHGFLDGTR